MPSETDRQRYRLDTGDERVWLARLGDLVLPLPNFRWRREALAQHDRNHALTGYGFSARDECRLAAWELGRGCYDHWGARLLCRFLLVAGMLYGPQSMIAAYREGQRSVSACSED